MQKKTLALGAGALLSLSAAGSTQAQIANGSFETGNFASWVTQDLAVPFWPLSVNAAGTTNTFGWPWNNTPTDGQFDALSGWDGDPTGGPNMIRIAQDAFINAPTLTFDYRAAWDLTFGGGIDRTFTLNIEPNGGGGNLQSDLILTAVQGTTNLDTGPLNGAVDVSAFVGQTVRISFDLFVPEIFTGPAQFTLDNVQLVPGPGALALLGLAGLRRRRRRGN